MQGDRARFARWQLEHLMQLDPAERTHLNEVTVGTLTLFISSEAMHAHYLSEELCREVYLYLLTNSSYDALGVRQSDQFARLALRSPVMVIREFLAGDHADGATAFQECYRCRGLVDAYIGPADCECVKIDDCACDWALCPVIDAQNIGCKVFADPSDVSAEMSTQNVSNHGWSGVSE